MRADIVAHLLRGRLRAEVLEGVDCDHGWIPRQRRREIRLGIRRFESIEEVRLRLFDASEDALSSASHEQVA